MLVWIFAGWVFACVVVGVVMRRNAPAVGIAMIGSVIGAVVGFFVGNADGPAEVPAYTAVGASVGLMASGVIGSLIVRGNPPPRVARRAALLALVVTPFAATGLTFLLQGACPLYVRGKASGFCNFQGMDLLGGWISGVIVAFVVDALFVVGLLLVAAWQARDDPAQVPPGAEGS